MLSLLFALLVLGLLGLLELGRDGGKVFTLHVSWKIQIFPHADPCRRGRTPGGGGERRWVRDAAEPLIQVPVLA